MKFIDTMILGAGHSIIIPNLPATKDVEALEDYISKR